MGWLDDLLRYGPGWSPEQLVGKNLPMPAAAPPLPVDYPGRGIGSDYARSGGVGLLAPNMANMPPPPTQQPPPPNRADATPSRGIGSDYAASGGLGIPPVNDDFARAPVAEVNGERISTAQTTPDKPDGQPEAPPGAAPLPAGATPTAGSVQPPAPAAQPAPQPSGLGNVGNILGKIFAPENAPLLLAMGGGFAGAPSFGTGMGRAFTAAAPQAALLQQERLKLEPQTATYKALLARGIPQDIAYAASQNKDMLAQLLPQIFGAKQLQHVTIKDRMGNEIPLTFDPSTGKYRTPTGEPYGAGTAGGTSSMGDPNKTGEEYLATLDPMTRNEVKAFGEGRAPVTARNLQQMLPLVTQAYPGFQASQYPVMLATRKSYTSGKDFQETQALNTVSGHMLKLAEAADKLPNTNFPIINRGANWFRDTFTGSTEMTRFRNALVTTSNELAKAYHGGHVSDASYAAFQKGINEAQTPAEMKAAIGEIAGLLRSKIEAKESGYRASMGDAPLPSEFKATNDEARHAYEKINDWSLGIKPLSGAPPSAVTPAATTAPALPKLKKGQTTTINGVTITKVED